MGRRYAKILETVGNTPVVRIDKLAPAGNTLSSPQTLAVDGVGGIYYAIGQPVIFRAPNGTTSPI